MTSFGDPAGSGVYAGSAPAAGAPGQDLYDLAYLAGGPHRVAVTGLVALELAGSVDCDTGPVHELAAAGVVNLAATLRKKPGDLGIAFAVRAVSPPNPRAHPVEHGVYDVCEERRFVARSADAVLGAGAASPAVAHVRERLEAAGLLRTAAGRARLNRCAAAVTAAVTLPAAAFLALTFGGAMWLTVLVAMCLLGAASIPELVPTATGRGRRALRDVTRQRPRPKCRAFAAPLGRVPELPLIVALHGERILWAFDPALALALRVAHPAERSGCSGCGAGCAGGGCGGGCGGCGGGGCGE